MTTQPGQPTEAEIEAVMRKLGWSITELEPTRAVVRSILAAERARAAAEVGE